MIEAWTKLLRDRGASIENGIAINFGNPQAERLATSGQDVLVDLSGWSVVRVSGPDARRFLNAQLTNDVEKVDATHSQLSAWCTAQGRVLAVFRVFQRDDDYYLRLPALLREETIKRLRLYVLRANVKIDVLDDELVRFGLIGPLAERLLQTAWGHAPPQINACATIDSCTVLRTAGVSPRFEILAPVDQAFPLWEKLLSRAVPVGAGAWSWHDIMAGIPTVLAQTHEEFVPQMINLELIDGVNFKKGCYPGQEIVARMQYLGRLKQRMYRAHANGEPVPPGLSIYTPGNGQSVGTVVDAQPSPQEGVDLLVVLQTAAMERGELHLGSEQGELLSISPPPYPLPAVTAQQVS